MLRAGRSEIVTPTLPDVTVDPGYELGLLAATNIPNNGWNASTICFTSRIVPARYRRMQNISIATAVQNSGGLQ
jgi:hypothetical protein